MATDILSAEQVDNFLSHKLHFPSWKSELRANKQNFLTLLLRKHLRHICFQNITMTAMEPAKRKAPTVADIVENGLSGGGGVCHQLNYFLHLLLRAIGFETFVVSATFVRTLVADSHLMVIVSLEDDDDDEGRRRQRLLLLDVGSANPLSEPVTLEQLPHRRPVAGFHYEFRREESSGSVPIYTRYQIGGSFLDGPFSNESMSDLRFSFDLTPKNLEHFRVQMDKIFTDESASQFLRVPFLFRYTSDDDDDGDLNWVLAVGLRVVLANETERTVLICEGKEQLEQYIYKYFPELSRDQIRAAMGRFKLDK